MTRDNIRILEMVRALSSFEWEELKAKLLEKTEKSVKEPENTYLVTEQRVSELFKDIGISANLLGYKYLQKAIVLCAENPEILTGRVTTQLYPIVAKEFKTTRSRVERGMRHSIERTWDKGNIDLLDQMFGHTISYEKGKPTNSEFIAGVIEYLKRLS